MRQRDYKRLFKMGFLSNITSKLSFFFLRRNIQGDFTFKMFPSLLEYPDLKNLSIMLELCQSLTKIGNQGNFTLLII